MLHIKDYNYKQLLEMNLCLSCSCGKDSVALAILCHEKNIPLIKSKIEFLKNKFGVNY